MRQTALSLRKAAIVLVAIYSVLCGTFLVWQLVTRDQVVALSNLQLMGMLALFLLPAATAAAWEVDRRAALREPGAYEDADAPAESPAADSFVASPGREPMVHTAGVDRSPRHRRRMVGEAVEARR